VSNKNKLKVEQN